MIAIVAVGYNRPDTMSCLLQSLTEADYCGDSVDLIVSVDRGNNQDSVIKVAESLEWIVGEKIIRKYEERQGLRKHILACGDLTEQYDAVVVLEDDLIVSPSFYKYVKEAVLFYEKDDRIAGISLYSYAANEFCDKVFQPVNNGYDTYMMQVAQSWGQCWTKSMWNRFREWNFSDCENLPERIADMPARIYRWGRTSWKKNFMAYIVSQDKYFVYPYVSFSTNRSEAGTHRDASTGDYQVTIVEGANIKELNFARFEDSIKYDVYFERINVQLLQDEYKNKRVCMDLYGLKSKFENYDILFSSQALPYKLIMSIGLSFRPMEINCYRLVEGRGVFMYDITKKSSFPTERDLKLNRFAQLEYNTIAANWHLALSYGIYGFFRAIKRRIWGQ